MAPISQLFIVSSSREVLTRKHYCSDVPRESIDTFCNQLEILGHSNINPHMVVDGIYFYNIHRHNVYFVATSSKEHSPILVIEILTKLYHLCKDFCGTVNSESVTANLILILEILDEFMDFGLVQLDSTEKLKPYIQSEPVIVRSDRESDAAQSGLFGLEQRVAPSGAANKPVIRSKWDQETRKNEIFVDVIERISAIFGADGNLLRCELNGKVNLKSFLVGSPVIKLGLNEDLYLQTKGKPKAYGNQTVFDECSFHSSVNMKEFDSSRILLITPPVGEFSALTYQIDNQMPHPLPFKLHSFVTESGRDLEVGLRLGCEITSSANAVKVTVTLPVPKQVSSISQKLSKPGQKVELMPDPKHIVWKIEKIQGKSEISAVLKLINQGGNKMNPKEIGPAALDFEISGYVCSGLQVKFLRVFEREHSYVPYRWIRYITVTDSYIYRLH